MQYYERTDTIVKQIKDILSTDITSESSQEKLEGFKRDASAYGELPEPHSLLAWEPKTRKWLLHQHIIVVHDRCGSACHYMLSQSEGLSQGLLIVLLMMQLLTIGASSLQRRRASLRSMVGPLCKEVTVASCRL